MFAQRTTLCPSGRHTTANVTNAAIHLTVNGQAHTLTVPRDAPLLNILRNDLQLNGPKYGCGLGECGACSVLVDGIEARACAIPVGGVEGRHITTLESLGALEASHGQLHPVQQAFIDCQAAQCGYCLNGMILATVALLARHPNPTDEQTRNALAHNLCRCGAHLEILQAVKRAAELMASR
jgi:nicotinate dehydrogenase subunit A